MATADYNSQVKEVNTNTLPRGVEHHYLSKASQHTQRLNANFYPPALFNKKDPLGSLRGKCFQETFFVSLFPKGYTSRDSLVRAMF